MPPADLPPLSDEERAEIRRQVAELRAFTSAIPAVGLMSQTVRDMGDALARLLAERDSLAARVRELEAERDEAQHAAADAVGDFLGRAQEVRRAWDGWRRSGDALTNVAGVVALGAAIDRLCPPVEERVDPSAKRVGIVECKGWANDRPMPEHCEFLHHPDSTHCRRCGAPLDASRAPGAGEETR